MASNNTPVSHSTTNSNPATAGAKTEVSLRNEEAACIVEALRWYANQQLPPRKQAQCETLASRFERGYDI